MDLPSSRELELETLLRHRNAQNAELTDEVTRLRQYLSVQPPVSTTDSLTLPPPLVSLMLPHIHPASPPEQTSSGSSTITAALTQRVQLLQQENDELYDILKRGETGKLKEEVRGLRRVVLRLETALQESHQAISSLSTELDQSYETFMTQMRQTNNVKSASRSPRNSYTNASGSKVPPTGPRAYKKPRVSDSQASSPSQRPHASLASSSSHKSSSSHTNHTSRYHEQDNPPRQPPDGRGSSRSNNRMVVDDDDSRARPRSPTERERHHRSSNHTRESDRDRDRRDRDGGRRNGNFSSGGGGGRPNRRGNGNGGGGSGGGSNNTYQPGDRTLAERMGL